MKRLTVALYLLSIPVAMAAACDTSVWVWTYTARAQTVCLFTHYDDDGTVRNRAHQCGKILPTRDLEFDMSDGIQSFNAIFQQVGKDQICEDTVRAFSDIVQW